MRKIKNKQLYKVFDTNGKIHSHGSTKEDAIKQVNLLNNLGSVITKRNMFNKKKKKINKK